VQLNTKKLLEKKGNEIHIPVLKLLKITALNTILYEIIKDYGFTAHQAGEVVALLRSETGKYISSATHRIIKNRNWLIIAPNKTSEAENIFIEESDTQVVFQEGVIDIGLLSTTNQKLSAGSFGPATNLTAQLDATNIKFPLLLRKWKQGDYFYPLGMQKKKKLSRFFIDQKLSLTQKEKTWVIEMDKKIIWVVGMRIDDRFKITGNTKKILQISWCQT
jgi:tRNA(Ile)-lysidine synthase